MNPRDANSQDVIIRLNGFGYEGWVFYCPGCDHIHHYITKYTGEPVDSKELPESHRPLWVWNGDKVKPTFRESLLYPEIYQNNGNGNKIGRCHLFVTDGVIQFCSDSTHALAGKNVPLSRDNYLFK